MIFFVMSFSGSSGFMYPEHHVWHFFFFFFFAMSVLSSCGGMYHADVWHVFDFLMLVSYDIVYHADECHVLLDTVLGS